MSFSRKSSFNVYDIPIQGPVDEQFGYTKYPKIEQLTDGVYVLLEQCVKSEARGGRQYSRIVREAIQILKSNFQRRDLSLTYVAS